MTRTLYNQDQKTGTGELEIKRSIIAPPPHEARRVYGCKATAKYEQQFINEAFDNATATGSAVVRQVRLAGPGVTPAAEMSNRPESSPGIHE
jgi:hypothetical protein